MNFEEHAAKPLLRSLGIKTPKGSVATTPEEAKKISVSLGPAVIKAQVPTGKRGKAGGITLVDNPDQAFDQAKRILNMRIGGHKVEKVLVEEQIPIATELYLAIINDAKDHSPVLLFSSEGGIDIEEIAANHPDKLIRQVLDIRGELDIEQIIEKLPVIDGVPPEHVADFCSKLYQIYRNNDAELLEINPLVVTPTLTADNVHSGKLVALDCKFTLDDSAAKRQP